MVKTLLVALKTQEIDLLTGFLYSSNDIDGFEERDNEMFVYLSSDHLDKFKSELLSLPLKVEFDIHELPDKNWNEEWERNFKPVRIGNICCIRAPFHRPHEADVLDIVILPQMAFGTGHHETTSLMVECMDELSFEGRQVLDFGCGTGILAIIAENFGARSVDAIDIDEPAITNCRVNLELNNCNNVRPVQGSIETVSDRSYDLVLANLSRNVLLEHFENLSAILKADGIILISGFGNSDIPALSRAMGDFDLCIEDVREKGEWSLLKVMHSKQI